MKSTWEDVRKEMTEEKGLDPAVANKIGEYVIKKGGRDLLEELLKDETLTSNAAFASGLKDMGLLFDYLEILNVMPKLSFDLSLARGLDYYTGIIYEVVTEASAPPAAGGHKPKKTSKPIDPSDPDADRSNDDSIGIGSIAAGGRYDELVGMFANSAKGRVPCVGISFGVDRIFSIARAKMLEEVRGNEVDVFVMAFGGKGFTGLVKERMEVCRMLWDAGVKVSSYSFCLYFLMLLTSAGRILAQSETKTPPAIFQRRKERRPFCGRTWGRRDERGQSQDQGNGSARGSRREERC